MKPEEFDSVLPRAITRHLDHGVDQLDAPTRERLYAARRQAVSRANARAAATGVGGGLLALRRQPALWLGAAALLAGLVWTTWRTAPPDESALPASLDLQLLTGDLPPQVFADWGLVTQEQVEAVCLKDS